MKASLQLRDEKHYRNPLLRVKIPISVLGIPFISGVTAGDPADLSFNLCTNSLNGPSLKLSYNPNTTTTNPFSISLKSGVGIFGSPYNSPLIMSAHFNLLGNPNPTFSLQIKPQFGDFSLKKTAVSASFPNPDPNPNPNPNPDLPNMNGGDHLNYGGIDPLPERPMAWRNLSREFNGARDGFFSGVAVSVKTMLPVTKMATMKFRWGVNFPSDFGGKKKLPFLTIDKIGVERIEEKVKKPKNNDNGVDLEMLKGMCSWMRRDMEVLQMENRAMKDSLEEMMKSEIPARNHLRGSNNVRKNLLPTSTEVSSGFESRKGKKNSEEDNGHREMKKSNGSEKSASDISEELKRAIEAASSS